MHFLLSNGEIHFLWWFIQGSIMSPSARDRLWNAWGMCERHTWAFISVEAAFRQGYMHGPSILYEDLMDRAQALFAVRGPLKPWRTMRRFREKGPCLMCEGGYGSHSKGMARAEIVQKGRDLSELRTLALETAPHWQKAICGRCAGDDSAERCRRHLIEEVTLGKIRNLSGHTELVNNIARHLRVYSRSFRYGYHGTATAEDRAALISAVGWCSGWKIFLSIFKTPTTP